MSDEHIPIFNELRDLAVSNGLDIPDTVLVSQAIAAYDKIRANGQPVDPEADAEPFVRSWLPVDLASVLAGTYMPPQPTVGKRTDGVGLFYPGKMHTVVSETEAGKTWFALSATLDELIAGNHVVYVDFEDDEGGIAGRLLVLGVRSDVIAERFHYIRPTDPLGVGIHLSDLAGVLSDYAPTLGIVDGITEAMTLHNLDPIDNVDAAKFGHILPRRIARSGAAVASLDHVTKSADGRGRYALGAGHKLAGLDGASYVLDNREPFGIGRSGCSTIKIAKDRPGQLRKHGLPSSGGMFWFGDLVLDSHAEEFAEVTIEPPHEHGDDFRPTVLMGRISAALAKAGKPLTKADIEDRVPGRAQVIRQAIAALVDDGYVQVDPGHHNSHLHTLVKPYDGENR